MSAETHSLVTRVEVSEPIVGDIWEDLTPGYHRFVRIVQVGVKGVFIQRTEKSETGRTWGCPRRAPVRETSIARFNGQSSGFRFVERPTKEVFVSTVQSVPVLR